MILTVSWLAKVKHERKKRKKFTYKQKNKKHHTQFRSSLIRRYVMRFALTIIVIVTIIKKKHLLSDEIFMETFQDGEFLMKCRKYQ